MDHEPGWPDNFRNWIQVIPSYKKSVRICLPALHYPELVKEELQDQKTLYR